MVFCHNATLLLHLHGRACASVQHVNERAMLNCLSVGADPAVAQLAEHWTAKPGAILARVWFPGAACNLFPCQLTVQILAKCKTESSSNSLVWPAIFFLSTPSQLTVQILA